MVTSEGRKYASNLVISGLDLNHTILDLIDSDQVSPIFRTQVNNIKYRGSTARIHFALDQMPTIIGISEAKMKTIFTIAQSMEDIERAYDEAKYGDISKSPVIQFSFPSLFNPKYAPNGKHLLSATIQYIPYQLKDTKWDNKIKQQTISRVTNILKKFVPNISDIIIDTKMFTPIDFESQLGLKEGNLNHGEMTLDQFFFLRPSISTAQYKAPIENLFFCGPSAHPGGGLHGCNGINAAFEILHNS